MKSFGTKLEWKDEAYFIVDNNGVEMALGGLNATLRDYAKFGLLYANKGKWNGENDCAICLG